jgi:hypothetical protein
MNKNIFFVGLILVASGLFSPPMALRGRTDLWIHDSSNLYGFMSRAEVVEILDKYVEHFAIAFGLKRGRLS